MATVDLRSDTVTKPTPAMRKMIADAEVGDDVYGEDPTVRRLEERVAELIGTEAALFVASGTMANQLALRAHTRPGDEIIISRDAHCWRHEAGALAALSGAQTNMMAGYTFTGAEVRAAYKSNKDVHASPTAVVAVENTHNMGGGVVWDRAQLADVIESAHALGVIAHLDGARIWNAAVASKCSERDIAAGFDSVAVCLSKGLGAPAGSLICGTRDFIVRCRRLRKMHGGAMRQVGILAAAGLHAVDHHRARLGEDHANARALADALAGAPGIAIDLSLVHTNIVMIDLIPEDAVRPARNGIEAIVAACRAEGVLVGAAGPARIRAVTHLDVDRDACLRAAKVIAAAIATA